VDIPEALRHSNKFQDFSLDEPTTDTKIFEVKNQNIMCIIFAFGLAGIFLRDPKIVLYVVHKT
jgi:hypothetical protein